MGLDVPANHIWNVLAMANALNTTIHLRDNVMKEVQVWIATFHITEDIDVLTIVHSMVGVI